MRPALAYRWEVVLWLALAFFFNQADRQIFHVVMPLVKADLGLTDLELGLVAAVFSAVFALTGPVAGFAGDHWPRTRIVTVSLFAWSLTSLLTGFAPGLGYLILVRSVATGAGEGFHAPAAYALISEYHTATRARAMALHQTSVYLGIMVSGLVAGYIGQFYGWRAAFWWFGGAGVVVAAVMARRLRPSPAQAHQGGRKLEVRAALAAYFHNRSAVLLTVAFCSMVFVNIGCLTWMPTYLHERFGMPVGQAGFASMFYLHAAAMCGVLVAGPLSDRMARRDARARAWMQGAGLVALAPFLYWLGVAESGGAACVALAGVGLFRGVYEANIYAALHDVVPPRFHATASSAMIAIAYLLGCASPVALGAIKQEAGLAVGFECLPLALAPGALSAFAAARGFHDGKRNA